MRPSFFWQYWNLKLGFELARQAFYNLSHTFGLRPSFENLKMKQNSMTNEIN
jgi:hypothetical protein